MKVQIWCSRYPGRGIGRVSSKFVVVAAMATSLFACEEENKFVAPPPPKVTVAGPLVQSVTDYLEFTGTTRASARVEVRARVSGVLKGMHFVPGTQVQAGDLLFEIDRDRYEADVQAAEAELAGAKAKRVEADRRLKRAETLIKRGNIAVARVDEARADARSAQADILKREAELQRAKIDLGYTRVLAPISGRIGRNRVDIGNLVGEGEPTILTDVTGYDPMYVYFNLNELDLLRLMELYRKKIKEKGIDPNKESSAKARIPIQVGLSNEEGYPHEGILDFAESNVDTGTGTIQVRASIQNQETPPRLVPGLFTRVRMPFAERGDMPLVTERAIGADQSGSFVLMLNSKNVVEKRPIKLGRTIDGLRVIEDGVKANDRVVVNGLQRARPGATVDPATVEMSSLRVSTIKKAAQKAEAKGASKTPASNDEERKP